MSGLEDLYREIILDHYRSPRNRGELPCPPAHRGEGFNPLCGDDVVLYLLAEGGAISDVKIGGNGCSISQASASMMSCAIKGKSFADARAISDAFKKILLIPEADSNGHDAAGPDVAEPGSDQANSEIALGDLQALQGVMKFPVRIKCATLGWNVLTDSLTELDAGG